MKEIWIKLELYFESYDFLEFLGIFSDFSAFFWILFEIKTV